MVVVADTAGEGTDKPCLALDCGAAPGLQARRADRARGGGQRPHDRRARDRRRRCSRPGATRSRPSSRPGTPAAAAARRSPGCCSGTSTRVAGSPASPKAQRDLPTSGSRRRYPGVADKVHYGEGVLVGYRWFEQRNLRMAPVRPRASYGRFIFEGMRVRRAGSGARQPHRAQPRPARGRRRPAALPRAAGRAWPRPRPAAEGLRVGCAAPGPEQARDVPPRRARSPTGTRGDRWRVAPAATGSRSAARPRPSSTASRWRCAAGAVASRRRAPPAPLHVAEQAHLHDHAVAVLGQLGEAATRPAPRCPRPFRSRA